MHTGYIKGKIPKHFSILFQEPKDRKVYGRVIQAPTKNFKVEGQKITKNWILKHGNTVTFEVAEDSAYPNGFKAINLMFPKPAQKPVKKPAQKPVKKPAQKTAKKTTKKSVKKMTREEWEKDPRPTIADMTEDDWYSLEADEDPDWMSRFKLPLPPLPPME